MVVQVPKVKKVCFREMAPRIATGVHVKIRSKIGVHVAAVCLIIGQNIPAFERLRTTCIDNGFRKKREAMITQKLFMPIILFGKIGNK